MKLFAQAILVLCLIVGANTQAIAGVNPVDEWKHEADCTGKALIANKQSPSWYKVRNSDTVIVFVHGIFSNSRAAWLADNCAYFPELITQDTSFDKASIFLGGFYTSVQSGSYETIDAADRLYDRMKQVLPGQTRSVMDRNQIVFVAHSTGGLVARSLLVTHQQDFQGKRVGLVLLASPTHGSYWANLASPLSDALNNELAQELQRDSQFLTELDSNFQILLDQTRAKDPNQIVGIEVVETKFLVRSWGTWNWSVVDRDSGGVYFRPPKPKPNANHFEVAKPTDTTNDDTYLWFKDFYHTNFESSAQNLEYSGNNVASLGAIYSVQEDIRSNNNLPMETLTLPSDDVCGQPDSNGQVTCQFQRHTDKGPDGNRVVDLQVTPSFLGARPTSYSISVQARDSSTVVLQVSFAAEPGKTWKLQLSTVATTVVSQKTIDKRVAAAEWGRGQKVIFKVPYGANRPRLVGTVLGRPVDIVFGASDPVGWLKFEGYPTSDNDGYAGVWSLQQPY